jgi:hypothetical protein
VWSTVLIRGKNLLFIHPLIIGIQLVEGKNNAGTNEARIDRSWSEVVTGKRREKTTNNEDQEKDSLF